MFDSLRTMITPAVRWRYSSACRGGGAGGQHESLPPGLQAPGRAFPRRVMELEMAIVFRVHPTARHDRRPPWPSLCPACRQGRASHCCRAIWAFAANTKMLGDETGCELLLAPHHVVVALLPMPLSVP